MKEFSIIDQVNDDNEENWYKYTGFVNDKKIHPTELASFGGWEIGTNALDVRVCDCVIEWENMEDDMNDLLNADSEFEFQQIMNRMLAELETIDGDFDNKPPEVLLPINGQSWIFVLGNNLHLQ